MTKKELTKKELLTLINETEDYDHLTIMKFTTHWRILPFTPTLHRMGRAEIKQSDTYSSLIEALESLK